VDLEALLDGLPLQQRLREALAHGRDEIEEDMVEHCERDYRSCSAAVYALVSGSPSARIPSSFRHRHVKMPGKPHRRPVRGCRTSMIFAVMVDTRRLRLRLNPRAGSVKRQGVFHDIAATRLSRCLTSPNLADD